MSADAVESHLERLSFDLLSRPISGACSALQMAFTCLFCIFVSIARDGSSQLFSRFYELELMVLRAELFGAGEISQNIPQNAIFMSISGYSKSSF